MNKITESTVELLEKQDYQCSYGPAIAPDVEATQAMPETDAVSIKA